MVERLTGRHKIRRDTILTPGIEKVSRLYRREPPIDAAELGVNCTG